MWQKLDEMNWNQVLPHYKQSWWTTYYSWRIISISIHLRFHKLGQGPLITDGRNRNEMFFSKISLARMPWHFKSNEDIITKFKWHGFQIIRINRKKFGGSGTTPSYFPALMNLAIFCLFHNTEPRDRIPKTLLFYFEGFMV